MQFNAKHQATRRPRGKLIRLMVAMRNARDNEMTLFAFLSKSKTDYFIETIGGCGLEERGLLT